MDTRFADTDGATGNNCRIHGDVFFTKSFASFDGDIGAHDLPVYREASASDRFRCVIRSHGGLYIKALAG